MRVLVINGSPSGNDSITLQTVLYLQVYFKNTEFEIIHAANRVRSLEKDFSGVADQLRSADLILFCYPVYTFLVPSQLHRFIELIKENGVDLKGKYATQITTSLHFFDMTAHRFIQDACDDLGMHYVRGLSAQMDDLTKKKGQQDAVRFFSHVLQCYANRISEPAHSFMHGDADLIMPHEAPEAVHKDTYRAVVVADLDEQAQPRLAALISRFKAEFPYQCDVVNIREFPFAGGCMGCFHCASDGTCIYKDGFSDFLRNNIQSADLIIYAFEISSHSMGYRFKLFDDRQFCNGHRTVTMGKPVGYLIDGYDSCETNLHTVIESRAEVGGNYLAGIASTETDPDSAVDTLVWKCTYALENKYSQPPTFYGVGGMKIFRDLIYRMRGMMREDHRFYKQHGFYDFPQKDIGTIIGMYAVGEMISRPALNKKLSGKFTEGMLMPYKAVIKKAEKRTAGRKQEV